MGGVWTGHRVPGGCASHPLMASLRRWVGFSAGHLTLPWAGACAGLGWLRPQEACLHGPAAPAEPPRPPSQGSQLGLGTTRCTYPRRPGGGLGQGGGQLGLRLMGSSLGKGCNYTQIAQGRGEFGEVGFVRLTGLVTNGPGPSPPPPGRWHILAGSVAQRPTRVQAHGQVGKGGKRRPSIGLPGMNVGHRLK